MACAGYPIFLLPSLVFQVGTDELVGVFQSNYGSGNGQGKIKFFNARKKSGKFYLESGKIGILKILGQVENINYYNISEVFTIESRKKHFRSSL